MNRGFFYNSYISGAVLFHENINGHCVVVYTLLDGYKTLNTKQTTKHQPKTRLLLNKTINYLDIT